MKESTEILIKTTEYIALYESSKVAEHIFSQFENHVVTYKRFKSYLRRNKIKFDMPKKNQKQDARRRLFIKWYVNIYKKNTSIDKCVKELSEILFVSESTITKLLWNYR